MVPFATDGTEKDRGSSWPIMAILESQKESRYCIHDPPSPDCRTSNPHYPFPHHTSVEMYLNSNRNTHCSDPSSKRKIERECVKCTDTPLLSPSTDKPPRYIHGTTPFHSGKPAHLFLHCFRRQKFQNQFESPFIIMILLKNLFLFNSLKAQPRIWKPSCILLILGLPFLNVWQGTHSFCVNHCCSAPDCLPAPPGNNKDCTGMTRYNF